MTFTDNPPNELQRFLQLIPASRAGAWLFARTLHHIDRLLLSVSGGRLSIPGLTAGLPVIQLTTIGAKSVQLRTVPVAGLSDGDKIVLVASNFGQAHHPAWYHNLRAHPEATLVLPTHSAIYMAHEATPTERALYWPLAADFYRGYPVYQQRTGGRIIPLMVLIPKSDA
ncbi:nitroreductase/quinone reductase family protein [soil metagenome]